MSSADGEEKPVNYILKETFENPSLDPRLSWFNEPAAWNVDTERRVLSVAPDPETDFWQKTHYGFQADSGHFLYLELATDAVIETRVSCTFKNQYDQAGLMVRVSPECWLKTSMEHETDEPDKLGAVVTRGGWSDWSTQDRTDEIVTIGFRMVRKGADFTVYVRIDEHDGWEQLRMAHLDEAHVVQVGLYACSPKQAGFTADFHCLTVTGTGHNNTG